MDKSWTEYEADVIQAPEPEWQYRRKGNPVWALSYELPQWVVGSSNYEYERLPSAVPDPAQSPAEPVAWRWRHSGGPWNYGEEKPNGPSIHLFEVEALAQAYPISSTERQNIVANEPSPPNIDPRPEPLD